jgi:hypothetical protein
MNRQNHHTKARSKKVILGVEALERRDCTAVSITTANAGHTLVLTGTNGDDTLEIRQNDLQDTVTVITGGAPASFVSSVINRIEIKMKAGKDNIAYKLTGGSNFLHQKTVVVDMGIGDDKMTVDLSRNGVLGLVADVKSSFALNLKGDAGQDRLDVDLGRLVDADVNLTPDMGLQGDIVDIDLRGDVTEGSTLNVLNLEQIFGNNPLGGKDRFSLDATNVDIESDCQVFIQSFLGMDDDILEFGYSGRMEGGLFVRLSGESGRDTVKANVLLREDSNGAFDVILDGGSGRDDMTFNLDQIEPANIVNAIADGGSGSDDFHTSGDVLRRN